LKELTPTFFPSNKRNAIIDNYNGKNLDNWGRMDYNVHVEGGGRGGGGQSIIQPRKIQWGVAVREKYNRRIFCLFSKQSRNFYCNVITPLLKGQYGSSVRWIFDHPIVSKIYTIHIQ
jgi:hypothetical protein